MLQDQGQDGGLEDYKTAAHRPILLKQRHDPNSSASSCLLIDAAGAVSHDIRHDVMATVTSPEVT